MKLLILFVLFGILLNSVTTNSHSNSAPIWTKPGMMRRPQQAVISGATVAFRCIANGSQPLNVQWFKNGNLMRRNSRVGGFKLRQNKMLLRLSYAVKSDEGMYKCIITNSYGSINHTYELIVEERASHRPILQYGMPTNKTAKVGSDVTFRCIVYSDPHPHIQWLKHIEVNGSKINPKTNTPYVAILKRAGANMTEEEMQTLSLKNVSFADAGRYTCLAGNSIGLSHKSAWLTVLPEDKTPQVSSSEDGMSVGGTGGFNNLLERLVSVIQTESEKNRQTWHEIADRLTNTLTSGNLNQQLGRAVLQHLSQ